MLDRHGYALFLYLGWDGAPPGPYGDVTALVGEEEERFLGMRKEQTRTRFLATRWVLREVVAAATGGPRASVHIHVDDRGRPCLPVGSGLDINLSHTHGALLVGISTTGPIGVDVEAADRDLQAVVPGLCSPEERNRLDWLPPTARQDHLVRLWTVKEAVGKSLGLGLAVDFTRFSVDFNGSGARLDAGDSGRVDRPGWRLHSFPLPGGYIAAVAQYFLHEVAP